MPQDGKPMYSRAKLANRPFSVAPWILGLALFILALATFSPSIPGPFLFDDRMLIEGNHRVHSFDHWYQWLTRTIWDTNYDPAQNADRMLFWRPLLLASFAFDWLSGSGSPGVFHITNLLFHAMNSVLVWLLFRRWFKAQGLALCLALLFALHPAQSEVVCWISGRGDSLCLLGFLVALHGLNWTRGPKALRALAFVIGALIAFASKEMAVVLPFFVILDGCARQRKSSPFEWLRAHWMLIASAGALVGLYLGWRSIVFERALGSHGLEGHLRAPFALEALGRGLALLFWPLDTTLGRAVTQSSGGILFPRYDFVALGAVALVLGSLLAWRGRRKAPLFWIGWLCFLGAWFPVSGIISHGELSLISPRYLYIPIVPALFLLGVSVERIVGQGLRLEVARRVLVLGALVFGGLSILRSGDFSSMEAFWKAEIVQNPHYVSAQAYYVVRELRENRPRSALRLALSFLESNRQARFESLNAELGVHVLEALAALTPDFDRDTLKKVAEFGDAVAQTKAASLELPREGVSLGWSKDSKLDWEWLAKRRRLLIVAGDIWSRLGEDLKALRRVDQAMVGCEQCWTLFGRAGIIQARAGKLGEALALAEDFDRFAGPSEKGQMRETLKEPLSLAPYLQGGKPPPVLIANYYSSLQAFGRAYAVAHDAFQDPPDDPEAHKVLAELALRAGDVTAARRMASRSMLPNEVEAWEREKLKSVLWQDAETPEGTWMPPIVTR